MSSQSMILAQAQGHRQAHARDFAECICDLVDLHFPKAGQIRIVLDNLSTHSQGALCEAFPAPEAHRILRHLEFHYTPTHACWLNTVEIGVLRGHASSGASLTAKRSIPNHCRRASAQRRR